jgi:hypothetical protein
MEKRFLLNSEWLLLKTKFREKFKGGAMKKTTYLLVISILFTVFILSDEPAKPVLKTGDVDHFVKTFPSLSKDFSKLGSKYNARKGEISFPQAMTASKEAQGILKKYNWDEKYFGKAQAIVTGYSVIKYGEQLGSVDDQLSRSLKEIDANPNLSQDMKKQLKQQLTASQQMMRTQGKALKQSVHPKDIELIKPFVKELGIALSDKKDADKKIED